eukprot:1147809-Pelagomonas_calceolata.AAC.1
MIDDSCQSASEESSSKSPLGAHGRSSTCCTVCPRSAQKRQMAQLRSEQARNLVLLEPPSPRTNDEERRGCYASQKVTCMQKKDSLNSKLAKGQEAAAAGQEAAHSSWHPASCLVDMGCVEAARWKGVRACHRSFWAAALGRRPEQERAEGRLLGHRACECMALDSSRKHGVLVLRWTLISLRCPNISKIAYVQGAITPGANMFREKRKISWQLFKATLQQQHFFDGTIVST